MVWCFFFFQAEDGIRDLTVTGVQTCALPIYCLFVPVVVFARRRRHKGHGDRLGPDAARRGAPEVDEIGRGRVGKEWRSRGAPHAARKNDTGSARGTATAPRPPSTPAPAESAV